MDFGRPAHVGDVGGHLHAKLADLVGDVGQSLTIDVHENEIGPLAGQSQCDGAADARRGACD